MHFCRAETWSLLSQRRSDEKYTEIIAEEKLHTCEVLHNIHE